VAKSSVATSSVFETGLPQVEQKATLSDSSVPQVEHLVMKISRYSLTQTSDFGRQTSPSIGGAAVIAKVRGPTPLLYYHAKR